MRSGAAALLAALWLIAPGCAAPDGVIARHEFFVLKVDRALDPPLLVVEPADGVRINALLPPALELRDTVIHFGQAAMTADSAYFTKPPRARVNHTVRIKGQLRASVCPPARGVCIPVVVRVAERY